MPVYAAYKCIFNEGRKIGNETAAGENEHEHIDGRPEAGNRRLNTKTEDDGPLSLVFIHQSSLNMSVFFQRSTKIDICREIR